MRELGEKKNVKKKGCSIKAIRRGNIFAMTVYYKLVKLHVRNKIRQNTSRSLLTSAVHTCTHIYKTAKDQT